MNQYLLDQDLLDYVKFLGSIERVSSRILRIKKLWLIRLVSILHMFFFHQ